MAPGPARAEPTLLSGTIGKAPVMLSLANKDGRLTGWYVYLRVGKPIRLEGTLKAGRAYTLDEFPLDQPRQKKTGVFAGTVTQGHWTGTWRKAGGGPEMNVDLSENHSTLARSNIDLQCVATRTDRHSGDTSKYSLALAMVNGTVRSFALAQQSTARSGGAERCAIDLADLKPVKSDTGFLLRTGDLAEDKTPRCTIRLVEAGDYRYVEIGDVTAPYDDCRGGDEVMYCGLRQDWADMIVDRKSSTCRPVE